MFSNRSTELSNLSHDAYGQEKLFLSAAQGTHGPQIQDSKKLHCRHTALRWQCRSHLHQGLTEDGPASWIEPNMAKI
jgi:hypothetical protein